MSFVSVLWFYFRLKYFPNDILHVIRSIMCFIYRSSIIFIPVLPPFMPKHFWIYLWTFFSVGLTVYVCCFIYLFFVVVMCFIYCDFSLFYEQFPPRLHNSHINLTVRFTEKYTPFCCNCVSFPIFIYCWFGLFKCNLVLLARHIIY